MRKGSSAWTGIVGGFVSVCICMSVVADGFRNPPDGAAAMGRGGMRLTQGEDPSAINNNPANLMDLDEACVMPSVTIGYARTEYTSPQGISEETEAPWRMLPSVYAAWPDKDGRYAFGIGINVPYGQSTEWDSTGVFQYRAAHFAQMSTVNVTPTMAAKLSESVSVGVGVNLMWSRLELSQRIPPSVAGPASEVSFDGDGYGIGAKAGLTWNVTDKQRIAMTYQSPVDINYEGDSTMTTIPATMAYGGDFETELQFPSAVGLGYGIHVTERLRVEANLEWVEHSRNEQITIDTGTSTVIPQNWDDVWVVGLGADLQLTDGCILRAGWQRMPTPVPAQTLMPTLPEGDNNIFGVGLGFRGEANTLDLAYVMSVFEDRTVANNLNPAVNGECQFESHLLLVSYTRAF